MATRVASIGSAGCDRRGEWRLGKARAAAMDGSGQAGVVTTPLRTAAPGRHGQAARTGARR
jgi:hypothetical protein